MSERVAESGIADEIGNIVEVRSESLIDALHDHALISDEPLNREENADDHHLVTVGVSCVSSRNEDDSDEVEPIRRAVRDIESLKEYDQILRDKIFAEQHSPEFTRILSSHENDRCFCQTMSLIFPVFGVAIFLVCFVFIRLGLVWAETVLFSDAVAFTAQDFFWWFAITLGSILEILVVLFGGSLVADLFLKLFSQQNRKESNEESSTNEEDELLVTDLFLKFFCPNRKSEGEDLVLESELDDQQLETDVPDLVAHVSEDEETMESPSGVGVLKKSKNSLKLFFRLRVSVFVVSYITAIVADSVSAYFVFRPNDLVPLNASPLLIAEGISLIAFLLVLLPLAVLFSGWFLYQTCVLATHTNAPTICCQTCIDNHREIDISLSRIVENHKCERDVNSQFLKRVLKFDSEEKCLPVECRCSRCLFLGGDRESKAADFWTRFPLKQAGLRGKGAFDVGYHGTTADSGREILGRPKVQLLMPGDRTHAGQVLRIRENHIRGRENDGVFCSPSLLYAACPTYATPTEWWNRQYVLVFEVQAHREGRTITQETIGAYEHQIDPEFSNDELEWNTVRRGGLDVSAVLVRSFPIWDQTQSQAQRSEEEPRQRQEGRVRGQRQDQPHGPFRHTDEGFEERGMGESEDLVNRAQERSELAQVAGVGDPVECPSPINVLRNLERRFFAFDPGNETPEEVTRILLNDEEVSVISSVGAGQSSKFSIAMQMKNAGEIVEWKCNALVDSLHTLVGLPFCWGCLLYAALFIPAILFSIPCAFLFGTGELSILGSDSDSIFLLAFLMLEILALLCCVPVHGCVQGFCWWNCERFCPRGDSCLSLLVCFPSCLFLLSVIVLEMWWASTRGLGQDFFSRSLKPSSIAIIVLFVLRVGFGLVILLSCCCSPARKRMRCLLRKVFQCVDGLICSEKFFRESCGCILWRPCFPGCAICCEREAVLQNCSYAAQNRRYLHNIACGGGFETAEEQQSSKTTTESEEGELLPKTIILEDTSTEHEEEITITVEFSIETADDEEEKTDEVLESQQDSQCLEQGTEEEILARRKKELTGATLSIGATTCFCEFCLSLTREDERNIFSECLAGSRSTPPWTRFELPSFPLDGWIPAYYSDTCENLSRMLRSGRILYHADRDIDGKEVELQTNSRLQAEGLLSPDDAGFRCVSSLEFAANSLSEWKVWEKELKDQEFRIVLELRIDPKAFVPFEVVRKSSELLICNGWATKNRSVAHIRAVLVQSRLC